MTTTTASPEYAVPLAASPRAAPEWLTRSLFSAATAAVGFGLLLALWSLASAISIDRSVPDMPRRLLPGPLETLPILWDMILNPFYDNGPNDKGIGIQAAYSLGRVFQGWGLGLLIAIPLGIALGANKTALAAFNPVIQTLRPVSPLAWFPLGLAVMKSAPNATVFVIVITSLWPTLINTVFGVSSVPDDYRNVAKVFRFSRWQYVTKVLLPYAVPHILTGLRLSMGIAWLVIVAAEMLAGGTGLGYFICDSYNAGLLTNVLAAILIIGVIGLLLDRALELIARKLSPA